MTTLGYNNRGTGAGPHPAFSIPSIIAAIAAIATFAVHSAGARLLCAILAAIFGVIGVVIALLPGKRGGIVSFISIFIGAIAFIIAIVQAISHLGGGGAPAGAY